MVIWMPSRYDARYKIDVTKGCLQRISDGKEVWGIRGKKGYHRLHFAGKTRCFHHIIWAEAHGRWPKKNLHVAHMDDVPYHNWVTNLREMTPSENNKMAAKHRLHENIIGVSQSHCRGREKFRNGSRATVQESVRGFQRTRH